MHFDIYLFLKVLFFFSLFFHFVIFSKKIYFYFVTIKKWKTIEGSILKNDKVFFRSKIDSETEGWKDKIEYKYQINGIEYKNDEISKNLGILLPFKNQTSPLSNDFYKVNQKITVFYNPDNPQQAIIDSKFNYFSLILINFFYLIIFVFIF
jgi:hypothetical protein